MAMFRNSFNPTTLGIQTNPFMQQAYRQYTGRPTGQLGMRQATETNALMMNMLNTEKDPEVRRALEDWIRSGGAENMSPQQASMAILQRAEQMRAENQNTANVRNTLQVLGREVGTENLPPELIERFGLDSSTPFGTRADQLRADVLRRAARARVGQEQAGIGRAQELAARGGMPVNEQDLQAIKNRVATMSARSTGDELGTLRGQTEGWRQQNVGRLSQALQNTTYQPSDYNLPGAAERPQAGTINQPSQVSQQPTRYGVRFTPGRELPGVYAQRRARAAKKGLFG